MKREKLWKRGLFATGLGLSIFLSSFGNVTGVMAADISAQQDAAINEKQGVSNEAQKQGASNEAQGESASKEAQKQSASNEAQEQNSDKEAWSEGKEAATG